MADHSITASGDTGPIPVDDPQRVLTISAPTDPDLSVVSLAGDTYTILISSAQTEGRYCLIDILVPDGGGPPLHRHDFEEMFTLLEGELEFTFRGKTFTVKAPANINIPANAPHRFQNRSGRMTHMLCMCTPGGQDEFFLSVGMPIDKGAPPSPKLSEEEAESRRALAQRLAPKYRTEMLGHP
ncbi:cupin domain-containing protein [Neorhizobium sp. P12A]|uniref:cupin domain-containing protein n=1 Tax=Neorhizobium sp. P12A TaxID=2268027 RepID=UPI0011ED1CA0|nr:cupin domain-containing protein [Neorhizobium sp. P12A]KAA0694511.1 cupin domain-containing protein [Neorhizobium sp. P12A]